MTYARLCEHGEVKPHAVSVPCPDAKPGSDYSCSVAHFVSCPGGSVLPDDSIVIVKERDRWPLDDVERLARAIYTKDPIYKPPSWEDCTPDMKVWYRATARSGLDALASAQGSQE
jgi:hypothetical protein